LRSVGGRVFFRLPFFCPDKRKVTIGFPLTLLRACFFGYFFFVAGDKEKVTFQPQMLWFNNQPIKRCRRFFLCLLSFSSLRKKV